MVDNIEPSVQHKLLKRQVKRCTSENGELNVSMLLDLVDSSYKNSDQEQYLYDQSLTLMSNELIDLNTSLKSKATELKESSDRYELASKGTNDGLWDFDILNNKCFYSLRWKEILGFDKNDKFETIDDWFNRISPEHVKAVKTSLYRHIEGSTERFEVEYQIRARDEKYLWVQTRGIAARDEHGKAVRIAGSQSDISQRKKQEEQLYRAAFHDKLTGLPNRALFTDRLKHVVKSFRRGERKSAALLFLDLDRFKIINDSLGHEAGDQLLVSVARRLELIMRPSDTICRLGGDEFTILLFEIDSQDQAKSIADRLLEELCKPYFIYGQQLYISGSIGIVFINEYDTPENFMRNADLAMYQAKHKGKSRFEVFEKGHYDTVYNTLQIETDLRNAVGRHEFVPYFQPIVNLRNGHVEELEVLVRWIHPERGVVPPLDFIPIAEETNIIIEMSEYLFDLVCKQINLWSKTYGYNWSPVVAINLSVKQLFNLVHLEKLIHIFEKSGLSPGKIKFEVTESVIMEDSKKAFDHLNMLKSKGFLLAIDDFGTGYSSLSYVARYPFDYLKLDRSFISDLYMDSKKMKLVKAMIGLANDLGLQTVGEGVEKWEEIEFLQKYGCDFAQGYYFSRPLPTLEILDLLCSGQKNREMIVDNSLDTDRFGYNLTNISEEHSPPSLVHGEDSSNINLPLTSQSHTTPILLSSP